ncbi:hypothetical protein MAM1_0260c08857 [Mucor ambiguus]|uniref:Uncharacterized protein n=1 Tax=Mucor ambiguus TaxID=91626 RepID=A0A0C9MF81_9FUNG|nr:hypothetical protein MAM1_0260c08857 [Mucor ambiguus]
MSLDTTQTISRCQWINKEQITALWKLSNSSAAAAQANNDTSNLQDIFNLKQSNLNEQLEDIPSANSCSKFYVATDDTEHEDNEDDDEREDVEEDCYSTTWSFSSFEEDDDMEDETEQELHFVKKIDDHNNPVYATTTSTVKKPISLLTQMLNGSTPTPPMPSQQSQLIDKKPLLKRCQSKYQSLSSWFATSAATTN